MPLHHICFNRNATLEMIETVYGFYEEAAKTKGWVRRLEPSLV